MNEANSAGLQAQLSRLATKRDLIEAKNSIIQWAIGTMIATAALTLAIAVLALSGCASVKGSGSLAAQAAHYGVSPKLLHTAENHGYWPQISDHETRFCRYSEVTGSSIGARECLDPAQMQARLASEADRQNRDQRAMEQSRAACPPTSAC